MGSVTARALTACPSDQRHYLYPGEGVWTNPFIDGRYDIVRSYGASQAVIDETINPIKPVPVN